MAKLSTSSSMTICEDTWAEVPLEYLLHLPIIIGSNFWHDIQPFRQSPLIVSYIRKNDPRTHRKHQSPSPPKGLGFCQRWS